jgi:UDPglucose 6-dehydrogenase
MKPDRIIVGTGSEDTEAVMREHTRSTTTTRKMIVMDVRSAEFTKYAANCMLATKISFMNGNLAETGRRHRGGSQGHRGDPRIGYHFIYPGLGYGGSCFPRICAR